jgi:hypothetical protein
MQTVKKNDPILEKEPILKRMVETKDYIVKGGTHYMWTNTKKTGALIEALSSEECQDLFRLESLGLIKKETYER